MSAVDLTEKLIRAPLEKIVSARALSLPRRLRAACRPAPHASLTPLSRLAPLHREHHRARRRDATEL